MPDDFETTKARLRGEVFESPTLGRQGPVPIARPLPTIENLRAMSNAEVLQTLEAYGVTAPLEVMKSRAAKYVERLTEFRGDAMVDEVFSLVDTEARGGIRNAARRTHQMWATLDALQGQDLPMMWIVDGSNTCENCEANAGRVELYSEWVAEGLPGASVCLGMDACQCDLILAEGF